MEAIQRMAAPSEFTDDTRDLREARRARLAAKVARSVGMDPQTELGLGGPMLRTGEVALLFGVSERCIRNWANSGKLPSVRTLGRHRLFPAREVATVLRDAMRGSKE
ncbi:MAG: helix-turn-helix domain-containing protein [Actinomycetota bacterium]|nr:helix-turn-helix domain-containing protein [Actinomycetota bacterium]